MIVEISVREPHVLTDLVTKPPTLFLFSEKAAEHFYDFLTSHIQNTHTRPAYTALNPISLR